MTAGSQTALWPTLHAANRVLQVRTAANSGLGRPVSHCALTPTAAACGAHTEHCEETSPQDTRKCCPGVNQGKV